MPDWTGEGVVVEAAEVVEDLLVVVLDFEVVEVVFEEEEVDVAVEMPTQ